MAVVERFKQELMYGLSAGTKKCGRYREVAVSGGSTVVKDKCGKLHWTGLKTQGRLRTGHFK